MNWVLKDSLEIAMQMVFRVFLGREIICGQKGTHERHGGFWELLLVWHG